MVAGTGTYTHTQVHMHKHTRTHRENARLCSVLGTRWGHSKPHADPLPNVPRGCHGPLQPWATYTGTDRWELLIYFVSLSILLCWKERKLPRVEATRQLGILYNRQWVHCRGRKASLSETTWEVSEGRATKHTSTQTLRKVCGKQKCCLTQRSPKELAVGLCALFSLAGETYNDPREAVLWRTPWQNSSLNHPESKPWPLSRHWDGGGDKGRQTEAVGGLNTLWSQKMFFAVP